MHSPIPGTYLPAVQMLHTFLVHTLKIFIDKTKDEAVPYYAQTEQL